jgi:hypothetical protein
MADRLKLKDVRAIFRLIGEVRQLGSDPNRWRPHMVRRLRKLLGASIVVSSEVHLRPPTSPADAAKRLMRIIDIGWGCGGSDESEVWRLQSDSLARPEEYMLALASSEQDNLAPAPVKPTKPLREGKSFILSQYPLPHLGAVDQLGIHQEFGRDFTHAQQRLVRLFHVELGRLWKKDASTLGANAGSAAERLQREANLSAPGHQSPHRTQLCKSPAPAPWRQQPRRTALQGAGAPGVFAEVERGGNAENGRLIITLIDLLAVKSRLGLYRDI